MEKPPDIGFKEKLSPLLRILYTGGVGSCKLFYLRKESGDRIQNEMPMLAFLILNSDF